MVWAVSVKLQEHLRVKDSVAGVRSNRKSIKYVSFFAAGGGRVGGRWSVAGGRYSRWLPWWRLVARLPLAGGRCR